jgi:hypothetical protein
MAMSEAPRKWGLTLRKLGFYALAVLIVACAVVFLIGRYQIRRAGEIRRATEVKLIQAMGHIAKQTMDYASDAQVQASRRNWDSARLQVDKVMEGVRVLEQVTPANKQSEIAQLKRTATDAQNKVTERSDDAPDALTELLQAFQKITDWPFTR